MGKEIFKEVKEFLNYIIERGRDQQKTSWEFLKKKFGGKKYERMYDFCVHRRYIGSLPYRKGDKRDHYIYVMDSGFAFLEDERRRKEAIKADAQRTRAQEKATAWQRIYSLSFIVLTIFIIGVTIYFNIFPQPYKPDIHLSTNHEGNNVYFSEKLDGVDFLLYIYNQGTGACIDMKLHHSEFLLPHIRPQKTFRQYTDIKGEIKDEFNSSTFISGNNVWRMGILDENEVIVIDLVRRNKDPLPKEISISISCNNGEEKFLKIIRRP